MNIYYLYIKTHRITGLQYLGYTSNNDPHKYAGSGKYWRHHLKKHGYNYDTKILHRCISMSAIKAWGLFYSNLWDVVKSNKWANLKIEAGDGGAYIGFKHTEESKKKISDSAKKRNIPSPKKGIPISDITKNKISNSLKGRQLSEDHKRHLSEVNLGKRHSAESKSKISAARLGKPRSQSVRDKISSTLSSKKKKII